MKIIDGILYLEISEAVEAEVGSEKYLWKAKSIGTKCYTFISDPADKRKALLNYDELKQEHKAKVDLRFGNPYDLCARQPILRMVEADPAAHDFFFSYTYDRNSIPTRLDAGQIAKSTRTAAWLALINRVNDKTGWRDIKDSIGLKHIPEFYTHAAALIELEIANGKSDTFTGPRQLPGNFPSSYQRLKEKAAAFAAQGFDYCLPTGLGNKVAAKIGKTETGFDPQREAEQLAAIRHVAKLHMNLDAAQVNTAVKSLFTAKGWAYVGDTRIRQILTEMQELIAPGRRGRKAYLNGPGAIQVKRKAPDYPIQYWTLDGWTAELVYQEDGKYHHRLDMVIVLDPFNKYPIGFAIGEHENTDLIRQAVRNAIIHLKDLSGAWYRPRQLQSDNYGKKNLEPFFQAVSGLHTPAAVGNAKAKVIEPYFKYLNKKYCQLQGNWSGFNITARQENQVNSEMLREMRHSLPDKATLISQLCAIIHAERELKGEAYVTGLQSLPIDKCLPLEYLGTEWLRTFGEAVGEPNSLTGQGIIKRIAGQNITYDCFEPLFRQQHGIKWQIWADSYDTSKVLAVSPDGKQTFVLDEKRALPMAAADHTAEDWAYLTRVRQANQTRQAQITQTYAQDTALVGRLVNETTGLDSTSENILKLMPVYGGQQKEQLQKAKGLRKKTERIAIQASVQASEEWTAQQAAFHASRVDVNKYVD